MDNFYETRKPIPAADQELTDEEKFMVLGRQQMIDHAIRVLNEAFELDPNSLQFLFAQSIRVNNALAEHPTIQIGENNMLSLIGLICGLFGIQADGNGFVAKVVEKQSGRLRGFCEFRSK